MCIRDRHCTTRLVLKTPKTETSNRTVWLPKTVAKLLVQYKKDQQELKEFLGNAYNDYNLVIALENGNPVESRIVRDRFQKLCEENDFEIVVFHSLRHLSTGYKLKMTNGDVKSVQGDTGHAEAEMVTDVYSEIIDEDRRFNAQKMDKEFYSNLNDEEEKSETETSVSDSDMIDVYKRQEQSGENAFTVAYEVDQQIKENDQTRNVSETYIVTVHVDADGDMVIIQNPTLAPAMEKSDYEPKAQEADNSVDADTTADATAFLETFFKLYPTATDKELAYYVEGNALEPVSYTHLDVYKRQAQTWWTH